MKSRALKRFKKNKGAVISGYFIAIVCVCALLAPVIAPYSFDEQNMDRLFSPPSAANLLGTDNLGRDLASRLIYGARMSMAVGIFSSLIGLLLGAVYGSISGWIGGRVDSVMMRAIDILNSIPSLVILILVKIVFDSVDFIPGTELRALFGILIALSVVGWVTLARVVRGQVLQAKQMLYVEAARAMGASDRLIIVKHIFPNIIGPVIVLLTFQIPSNILAESFLSFVGLGLQPPYSSWGVLANEGWRSIRTFPHLIIFPMMALFLTMLAFNLFGDGLRDALDPKTNTT